MPCRRIHCRSLMLAAALIAVLATRTRPAAAAPGAELSAGGDLGAPLRVSASVGLLVGVRPAPPPGPARAFSELHGVLAEARIGQWGESLAIGPSGSVG